MQRLSIHHAVRATALVVALLLAGEAIAEQKNSTADAAMANCLSQAALQLSLNHGNCAPLAPFPDAYGPCVGEAIWKYQQAVTKCTSSSLTTNRLAKSRQVLANSSVANTTTIGRN
jgi:hypothetical protein